MGSYLPVNSSQCPSKCYCEYNIVNCSHLNLTSFPVGFPKSSNFIDLSFNFLTVIPSGVFIDQANVSELYLNNNRLNQISEKAFEGLDNLQVLNLCWNRLISIKNNKTFCSLPKLKKLYLCQNSLKNIPDICELNFLSTLDFSGNILNVNIKFPFSFKKSFQLGELKLNSNNLFNITMSAIEFLPVNKLVSFECSGCGLSYLPLDLFRSFSSLKFLNLSKNLFNFDGFSSLISSLENVSSLIVANFSYIVKSYSLSAYFFKPIANISLQQLILTQSSTYIKSDTFASLHLLKYLDLSFSIIDGFDQHAFRGLTQLKYLLLSDCQLFQQFPVIPISVVHLNLHHNYFRSTDGFGFENLRKLEEIDLSNNLLPEINFAKFKDTHSLQTIKLENNLITAPTSAGFFFEMFSLQSLNFDNNKLVNIDWSAEQNPFTCMGNLITLSMRNNDCQYIEKHIFNHLKNLQYLYLDVNRLRDVINTPNLFKELIMLREISLTENDIHYLSPNIFSNLANLVKLDLRNNFISSWEPTLFMHLNNLKVLLLSKNRLALINESSVKYWPKDINFDLSENPFNCWCDLLWFIDWFQKSTVANSTNSSKYICSAPIEYESRLVSLINVNDVKNSCVLLPWKIIVISVATGASLLVGVSLGIIYRYQWNIRLCLYKFQHRSEIDNNLEDSDTYNIFISHEMNNVIDNEWASQLAEYIEQQRLGIILENSAVPQNEEENYYSDDEITPLLTGSSQTSAAPAAAYSTNKCWKVYCYERECTFGEDYLEKLSKAITTVRYVIVGLSTDYLNDRQCQFELDQLKYEMIRRYGRQMKHRIILTTLNNNGELLHKLPKDLNFYNNSQKQPLNWVSSNEANHEWFKKQVFEQLIQISRSMREY